MVKSTITSIGSSALSANAAAWKAPLANCLHAANVTTANAQLTSRPGGTYSNLRGKCTANTTNAATTLRFLDNVTNSACVVSITAASTGAFEDTVNTEAVTDGTQCYFSYLVPTGTTGTATLAQCQIDFEATTDVTKTHTIFGTNGVATTTTASATYYHNIGGQCHTILTTPESASQYQFKKSCTLKNWRVRVTADSRTGSTTYRLRKNGANAAQSVSTSATGHFEDTTNTDSIVADDKVNVQVVLPSGTGAVTWTATAVNIETSDNISFLGTSLAQSTGAHPFNTAAIYPYGHPISATVANIANAQSKLYRDAIVGNLSVNIAANSLNGATTICLNDDGSNINPSVSPSAGATGFFSDTTNTSTVAANSLITLYVGTAGSSGTIGVNTILHEVRPSITLYDRPISNESTVSVSESLTRALVFSRPISDTSISVSEALARVPVRVKAINETAVSVSEALARIQSLIKTINETSISVSEALARVQLLIKPISEPSISVSEALVRGLVFTRPINESAISTNDSIVRLPLYLRPISNENAITTNDSIARWISVSYTLAEPSISVNDSIAGILFYPRTINESAISVNDTIVRLLAATRTISESSITVNDTISRIQTILKQISESAISVNDSLQGSLLYTALIIESRIKWYYSLLTRKII